MRARWATAVLFVMTVMPRNGNAQVYQFATPPPQVTATSAWWQIESVPIQFDGIVYAPTALVRPFDGNVMTQVGAFAGVPVYADATLEPFSVLYVPVARGMRTYERRRSGEMAGTEGSRTPMTPIDPTSAIAESDVPPAVTSPAPVATTGAVPAELVDVPKATTVRPHVETVPRPRATDGVWIRYDGAKWYSDGEAVPYIPDRFTQIGTYHGFPVYRERDRGSRDIWVAVVQDGPVAPYARR